METRGEAIRTSEAVRRAIRDSRGSIASVARRYDVDPRTVRRWRQRSSTASLRPGPRRGSSSALAAGEEALVVVVRHLLMLPLDDCLHVLRIAIPDLTRASLHRCLRRHGYSRLPEDAPRKTQVGVFDLHMFVSGAKEDGRMLLVAVEQASRFIHAEAIAAADARSIGDSLSRLSRQSPVGIRRVRIERAGLPAALRRQVAKACADCGASFELRSSFWSEEQAGRLRELIQTDAAKLVPDGIQRIARLVDAYNMRTKLKAIGGSTPRAFLEARARALTDRAEPKVVPGKPRDTREHVLDCARALLATAGADGVSLSRVAKLAGLNRGTIYHHFASRRQLLDALNDWSSDQLCQAIFPAQDSVSTDDDVDLVDVVTRLAEFAAHSPTVCQAWLLQLLASRDPSSDRFWTEYLDRSVGFHQTPRAQEDIDAEVLSVILLAGSFLWPLWARSKDADADTEGHVRRFVYETTRLALYGTVKRELFPDTAAKLRTFFQRRGQGGRASKDAV